MSTKYLARTIIEGGRRPHNRWERRYSHREARAAERQVSVRVTRLDSPDDAVYEPRRHVWRTFDDKLGPARRWLRSQVGRPWDKVQSELFQRFDTRTTAGRHILFDHLLASVRVNAVTTCPRWFDFAVDRVGILRETPRRRLRHHGWRPLPDAESVLTWLGERRVGERDTHLYWFVPTPAGAFRQASPLEEEDAVRWRSLPSWFRKERSALF